MSISKLTVFSFSLLLFITLFQISKAQNTGFQTENMNPVGTLLTIVDPAQVAGTEVLLKDL